MKTPAYNLRAAAKWRKKQQAAGFCARCCKHRPARGNYCSACRRYFAEYSRQRFQQRRAMGLCGMCGKRPTERFVNCIECRRKRSER